MIRKTRTRIRNGLFLERNRDERSGSVRYITILVLCRETGLDYNIPLTCKIELDSVEVQLASKIKYSTLRDWVSKWKC